MEYLHDANKKMQKYHEARELMRKGKLKSKNAPRSDASFIQLGIGGAFVLAFLSMPFLGKKIAQDEEFRNKWIPKWYDYTVRKPENPWTREELHEQMLAVQQDLRERAIRGEFTPENLAEMQRNMSGMDYPHRAGIDRSKIPSQWDRIHPGLDDDEELDERDS